MLWVEREELSRKSRVDAVEGMKGGGKRGGTQNEVVGYGQAASLCLPHAVGGEGRVDKVKKCEGTEEKKGGGRTWKMESG